jgi:hypothetical protein
MTGFEPPPNATTITFPQPAALLNMNSREHWRPYALKKKAWRAAGCRHVQYAMRTSLPLPPSYFMITVDVPDKRRRDPANYHATGKVLLDSCVDAALWPDDTPDWVTTLEPRLRINKARTVTIHIWPRDDT